MAKPYDATLKRMIDDYAPDWAAWLAAWFGLPAGPLVPVESDLSTIQPAADKVFRLPGDAGLLHLEVQSSWTATCRGGCSCTTCYSTTGSECRFAR